MISQIHRRHRAVEFKKFLVAIDKAVPTEFDVRLICDNLATHKTQTVNDWLASHPRLHIHFTPTGSSWINQVERWFGFLTDQLLLPLSIMILQQIEYGGLLSDGPLRVDEIASRLDDAGMVRLIGAVPPDMLASAQDEIAEYISNHGTGDHDLLDHTRWESPTLQRIAESERVESLLNSLASWRLASSSTDHGGYSRRVLRIHDGTGAIQTNPYVWHYDASTLTMHIPISIPGGNTGDLAAFPAHRPRRRTAVTSLREKLQPHDRWAPRTFFEDPARYTIPLVPGDAYIFHGYRTLHTGLPWPRGDVRANLILHYGYPRWAESRVLRTAHAIRLGIRKFRGQVDNAG